MLCEGQLSSFMYFSLDGQCRCAIQGYLKLDGVFVCRVQTMEVDALYMMEAKAWHSLKGFGLGL
jgi:hypothetical protein